MDLPPIAGSKQNAHFYGNLSLLPQTYEGPTGIGVFSISSLTFVFNIEIAAARVQQSEFGASAFFAPQS